MAAGIHRRATRFGYSPSERTGADHAATYLTNNKPYLDYHTALAGGWPIATGIIEGACRHLAKDRMDITGARWGLHGAQAVLTLRTLGSNGDFDATTSTRNTTASTTPDTVTTTNSQHDHVTPEEPHPIPLRYRAPWI